MLYRKPCKGETIVWPDSKPPYNRPYVVVSTPEPGSNLCWIERPNEQAAPFIWRFNVGLNQLAVNLSDTENGKQL